MKKTILTLAIAIAAVCGLTANAQAPADRTPGANNKMYQPREFTDFAFEGILLDINQQTRIDSLHAALKANCPQVAKTENCDKQCDKQCDKKCDKKADKQCDKQRGRHYNPARNPQYMAKVKEILTPEQYTQFLENVVKMQPQGQGKRTMHRPHDKQMPGQMRDGKKMDRKADKEGKTLKTPKDKAVKGAKAAKQDK